MPKRKIAKDNDMNFFIGVSGSLISHDTGFLLASRRFEYTNLSQRLRAVPGNEFVFSHEETNEKRRLASDPHLIAVPGKRGLKTVVLFFCRH
jgi:hypothetical protein